MSHPGQIDAEFGNTKASVQYHRSQYDAPFASTMSMLGVLDDLQLVPQGPTALLDVCCGMGANAFHVARRFPDVSVSGIDRDPDLIAGGRREIIDRGLGERVGLAEGDLYRIPEAFKGRVSGVIFLQTLSWLLEPEPAIQCLCSVRPDWILVSSLFYDGPLDCRMEIFEPPDTLGADRMPVKFQTIISLTRMRDVFDELGYSLDDPIPFDISVDLKRPADKMLGTFTRRMADGSRQQWSGPMPMPWYHIVARRRDGAPA